MKTALFILPTTAVGGAEKVTRILAECAAENNIFDKIEIIFLCGRKIEESSNLKIYSNVQLTFLGAKREVFSVHKLVRRICNERYELVFSTHTHINSLLSLLRYLKILRASRLITRESTLIFERQFGFRTKVIRSFYNFYGSQDLIICQTERMAESFKKNTPEKLHDRVSVIENPVVFAPPVDSFGEKRTRGSDKKVLIAWCGRLVSVKNPHLAIDTIAKLNERGFVAELTFVGDGPLKLDLENHARDLGISHLVSFVGIIDRPKELFDLSTLGLITSDIEGFPNVVLEMLASKIHAVVSTDCAGGLSGLPDVFVTKVNEAETLSERIVDVLTKENCPNYQARAAAFFERTPRSFLHKCGI